MGSPIDQRDPGSPKSRFARLWTDAKTWIAMPGLPARSLAEIRTQQARGMTMLCPVLCVAGVNTLAALAFGLPGGAVVGPVRTLAAITAIFYGAVLVEIWLFGRSPEREPLAQRFIDRMTFLVLGLGVCWCAISILIACAGGRADRDLLFGVDIGLVSSAALLMPRRLALAFWVPATVGGLAGSAAVDSGAPALVGITFLGYALVIAATILAGNRALVMRVISQIRVEDQAEVIQLLLRDFEKNASDWLWETDERLRLTHVSKRLADVTAMSIELLRGLSLRTLIYGLSRGVEYRDEAAAEVLRSLDSREPIYGRDVRIRIADEERHWTITCQPVFDQNGGFRGYRGVGSDVTGEKISAREIAFLAGHDMLTALPNRRLATERLATACLAATHAPFALLCIDLDGFKEINDRFGHSGGDSLLVVVAQRLRESTRQNDLVARLGGDEFAILLRTAETDEITAIIRRLLASLAAPMHIQGVRIQIGASVGAARAPDDAMAAEALLHRADLALYQAKAAGRGTWRYFVPAMAFDQVARLTVEEELREAFAAESLHLNYAPILDLHTGQLAGAEASIRWNHPTRGVLEAEEFVPLIKHGLILIELGDWMLRRAAHDAVSWPPHLSIAVSLSAAQLGDEGLSLAIEAALEQSGLSPGRLVLQIAGEIFPTSATPVLSMLSGLQQTGVRIALDDFAGQSASLFLLRAFSFDRIRIKAGPDWAIGRGSLAGAILRSTIVLGSEAGIDVTVRDVVDTSLLQELRALGCRFAQGTAIGARMTDNPVDPLDDATTRAIFL